jgi:hypothetical protein
MTSSVNISVDGDGVRTLFIRGGEWSVECEEALQSSGWEALAILAVEWPSYRCLVPYADRIKRIRVPFGPDNSDGFESLSALMSIESADVLKPSVDFRKFPNLSYLEAIWDKKKPDYFASPSVETLFLHQISGDDLSWIPEGNSLKRVELRAGRLVSLRGIERASGLTELVVDELKACVDVEPVFGMTSLHSLRLDAPKAMIEEIELLAGMPDLYSAEVYGKVAYVDWAVIAACQKLKKFGVSLQQDNAGPDDEIKKILTSLGKSIKEFVRYKGKNAGFYIEFS